MNQSPFENNELALANQICAKHPTLRAHKTGAQTARLDTVFTCGDQVRAVAEIKARKFDLNRQKSYGSTMIEFSKFQAGKNTSIALGVPFIVIVQLTDATMFWTVTNGEGKEQFPIERTNRRAQVSEVNKSKVLKDCALLPFRYGRVL